MCLFVPLGVTLGVTLFVMSIVSSSQIRLEFLNIFLNKKTIMHPTQGFARTKPGISARLDSTLLLFFNRLV